jgi:hypothetical protein
MPSEPAQATWMRASAFQHQVFRLSACTEAESEPLRTMTCSVQRLAWSLVFWDVVPCSQVEVDRRFRSAYCFYHHDDDRPHDGGVRTSETSVNFRLTRRRYIPKNSKLHTRLREDLWHFEQCLRSSTGTNNNNTNYTVYGFRSALVTGYTLLQ